MSCMNDTHETVELRLLPYEGLCLFESLEALAAKPGSISDSLAPLVDRLDDSNAAAAWLGEYVRLELHPNEVVELLDTLVTAVTDNTEQPPEVEAALSHVCEKLATFRGCRL